MSNGSRREEACIVETAGGCNSHNRFGRMMYHHEIPRVQHCNRRATVNACDYT